MKLYKVLHENGRACHGGRGSWPLPNGKPGEWLEVTGKLIPCQHGLHLCRRGDLPSWLGPAIFEAEHDGGIVKADDKVVVRRARLVRRVETWNDRIARLFAADCAERALSRARKAGWEPDPRSWEAVRVARAYANGEASIKELDAASDAAYAADAADAAYDAAYAAVYAASTEAAYAAAAVRSARAVAAAAAARAAYDAAYAAATDDAAAWDVERQWQTRRLFEYLNGKRG